MELKRESITLSSLVRRALNPTCSILICFSREGAGVLAPGFLCSLYHHFQGILRSLLLVCVAGGIVWVQCEIKVLAADGSAVKSHSTILQRLRRQISLDYYTIPPATQATLLYFGNSQIY